jgi:LysM repeat protein
MGGSAMLGVGQLGSRWVFVLALAIGVAGCSSEAARFNDDRYTRSNPEAAGSIQQSQNVPVESSPLPPQPVQQASVAPITRPPGVSNAADSKGKASNTSPPRSVTAVPSNKSASPGNSAVHVVKRGDTLNKISRLYRKPVADIAKANNIQLTTRLKVGDRLVIPSVTVNSKPGGFPAKIPNHSANSVEPAGEIAQAKAKHAIKAAKETTALPMFHWPVQGRIIASFGSSLSGERNDGIDLAVPEGTPVTAAEDGVVSYAGNGFAGQGNLVLIRHSNDYSTVYAHAKELLVKRGDQIKRGQVIAHSGQTGNVNAPQLHFEVRRGATPLDPVRFLKS